VRVARKEAGLNERRACGPIGRRRRSWPPSARDSAIGGCTLFLRREKTEEGELHARERDLKQAEDFCIVLNWAGNCPRAGATLCSKPCRVAWFSLRARGVAGLACYVAADGTRILS